MQTLRFLSYLVLAVAFVAITVDYAETAKSLSGTPRERLIEAVRKSPPRDDYHILLQDQHKSETASAPIAYSQGNQSIAINPPPASPGLPVGVTWLDMQYPQSLGKQIARNPGHDYVHMVWSRIAAFDPDDHWDQVEVMYTSYRISTGTLAPGFGGAPISIAPVAHGQYATVDVADDTTARPVLAEREDLNWPRVPFAAYLPVPGNALYSDFGLYPPGNCGEMLWPKHAVQQRVAADDFRHVLARGGFGCDDTRLYYWRFDGQDWSGPALIDSSFSMGHVIAADNNSDKVAIVIHDIDEPGFNGANNVFYYESTTSGLGWLSGSELGPSFKNALTNYADTIDGPQAWQQIDAVYDNAGALHIVWDEQRLANKTTDAGIRHWNSSRGTIRPVVFGYWPNLYMNYRLNLAGLSLGIGDGASTCDAQTNLDYVYLLFTQFAGPTPEEQADHGWAHPNGELYLVSSRNGGNTWSPPENLTNTKTPNCNPQAGPDSVCRSEDWATLNKFVSDIDILYISDHDAGPAAQNVASYQPNDVMYLRIPGGGVDDQYICPVLAARLVTDLTQDLECEYHAGPDEVKNDEVLTIQNIGNAGLNGTISVLPGAPWLTVVGAGVYSIADGGTDLTYQLVMDATGLEEGAYTATISIAHNDPTLPSPQELPIDFFVISDFRCPQSAVISTGVE
jgi:hypothetical protein